MDYINIVFYDDNNKSIGNTEHLLLDQDSDEAADLVFNEKRMKGSVSNFEKSKVTFGNAKANTNRHYVDSDGSCFPSSFSNSRRHKYQRFYFRCDAWIINL